MNNCIPGCTITAIHCHEVCNHETGETLRITTLHCPGDYYCWDEDCDC